MEEMERLQDIRILSLYKQHYFDRYRFVMECDYSCLGYYDGISITDVDLSKDENGSKLFEKKSNAAISPVWCGTALNTKKLNGQFGKQDIGIFRCIKEGQAEQDKMQQERARKSPYFAVAFIQLSSREDYMEVAEKMQKMFPYNEQCEEYIVAVPYFTYDNADLIMLIYGNRMREIDRALLKIEKLSEVCYLHSVFGISEMFLKECGESKSVLEKWHGKKCYVDDKISHIVMNIATVGNETTVDEVKAQFTELLNTERGKKSGNIEIKYYHSFGHGKLSVDMCGADVGILLMMLWPKGLATHQNLLFGREIYNIETMIRVEELCVREPLGIPKKIKPEKESENEPGQWFARRVTDYKNEMQEVWGNDEGLYSYYCALAQIANTLAQYEGFSLSRDIFLLLFPAFKMFDDKLKQDLKNIKKDKERKNDRYREKMIHMKDAIHEFVNAVNSVVYHTVHTDQVFLMIPGCSGTTFSIPIKLCLVYLNIIHNVINILNDKQYTYSCLLTPELEIRPATSPIDVGFSDDDRLVRFTASQRSLYMPRHFIILLTHEMAHYTGTYVRKRHLRLQCISRTLAHLLAEGVYPERMRNGMGQHSPMEKEIYDILCDNVLEKIQEKSVTYIFQKVSDCGEVKKEHSLVMTRFLKEACYELLEEKGEIYRLIWTMGPELRQKAAEYDIIEFTGRLDDIRGKLDQNRRKLFASRGIIDTCIDELVTVYKEVFSDTAAYKILEFDQQTFSETFSVSEGNQELYHEDKNKTYDVQRDVRKAIIQRLTEDEKGNSTGQDLDNTEDTSYDSNWPDDLKDNLFSYSWTGDYLYEYAARCAEEIGKIMMTAGKQELVDEIRAIYDLFKDSEASCQKIYEKLIEAISSYERKVTELYKSIKDDQ